MTLLFHFVLLFLFGMVSAAFAQETEPGAAPTIEGTWRWRFTMPDGTVSNPTLKLALDDGKLSGTSSFRRGGETPITNAVFRNNQIRFQVIRDRDGRDIVTTYSGKWDGKTIRGKIQSNWSGEPQTYDWEAEKIQGPNGVWKWTLESGGRQVESRLTLRQKGSKLEGSLGRGRNALRIKNGSISEDNEIYFEVETIIQETRRLSKYKGTLTVDTITGTVESSYGTATRKLDWVAHRAD